MTELAIQPDSDRDAGDDFVELAVRHLSGELDQRQRDRLNTQLAERPERRDEFIEICLQARLISNIVRNGDDIEDDDEDDAIALSKGEDVTPAKLPPSPYIGFLGSAYHGVTGYLGDHEWAQGVLGGTVFLVLLFAVLGSVEIFSRWRQANRPQPQDNQIVKVPAVRAAQLTGVFDCRWTGTFHPPLHEVLNVDDYINLASGLAEVTYDSGAKVLLQGPCTYKIESPSSGYLRVGRLTARVKGNEELRTKKEELPAPTSSLPLPTSSFVVNTPTATVTDLGTEFGVDVDKQGTTDSLVFVGSVKVNTVVGDGQKQAGEVTLIENQSARVERQGGKQYVVRRDVVKSDNFVRPDQIQEWVAMAREAAAKRKAEAEKPKEPPLDLTQFHRWQKFSKELCQRDDLLAYYDFQWDPDDKRDADNHELLRNKAKTAGGGLFGRNYDGQLWGAIEMGMIEGRFPGKHALKFEGHDDAVRINIPVECKQLTLATWVNIEQLSKPITALLTADGWAEPGMVHWQIHDGRLIGGNNVGGQVMSLSVFGVTPKSFGEVSETVLDGDSLRRWRFLAATWDGPAGEVAFYVDGAPAGKRTIASSTSPAKLGQAMIGAWEPAGRTFDTRFLEGRMDEFMIFNAALSAEEIRAMYEAEKPITEDSEQLRSGGIADPSTTTKN